MGKIKIYELSKELDLTSKEIIEKANKLGIEVKSHMSAITEEEANKIKSNIAGKSDIKIKKENNDKKPEKKNAEESPVIIRRAVIINDEEEESQKEKINKEKKKSDVGFVERNKNKDYNIVYRNKQTKPMTVSELFGIKNQDEKSSNKENETAKNEEEKAKRVEDNSNSIVENNKDSIEKLDNKIENQNNKNLNNKNGFSRNNNDNRERNFNNRDRNYNGNNDNRERNFNNRDRNYNGNNDNRERNFNNRDRNYNGNNDNRERNFNNRDRNYNGNNDNRERNFNNRDRNYNGNNDNRERNFNNRDRNYNGNNDNRERNFNNRDRNYNNSDRRNNNNDNRFNKRPLDEKGLDKNIKNIIETEIPEKEIQRDYSTNKAMDKAKNSRYEESRENGKKQKNKKNNKFTEYDDGKLKDLKQVDKLSHMFNDQEGGMLDYYDLSTERGKRNKKKFQKNNEERVKQKIFKLTEISIPDTITVKDLATELKKTSGEVIMKLVSLGIMATINNDIDFDTAYLIAQEFGVEAKKKEVVKEEDVLFDDTEDTAEELQDRPPVVVVMGHVDHGKTSLLDAIRSTNVIQGEAGGITQHIGAYKVNVKGREITFLDTPGHEAFTSMRARGAQITDIAILIVAANDGVMPQTIEAINHAKAAGIPIVVAVNKIDLPGANIDKIKQDLMNYELVPEEWGGDTIYVPISAKLKTNIDQLLEMVLLVADMKELKSNPNKQAKGTVIEARLDKAKGPIATMLVQRGTLDVGDTIVVGSSIGRIRAMKNDKGKSVKKAGPSTPVEIMGLTEVPEAGDTFYEVKDEKMAKHLIERRKRQAREKSINDISRVTLNDLFSQIEKGNLKQLNIIVKTDVQGTAEALKQSLEKLSDEEVAVKVIHSSAGAVTESDVKLAKVANAIIIAFNVRPGVDAKKEAEDEEVEIKQYSVIYQALEDVKAAMKGMLDPIFEEKVIGNVEVRQTFKVSNVGTIAGCYVLDGKVERHAGVRVIRENVVIHDGKLTSLKRFKDDVKEVAKGYECGIQIENYNDLKEGDTIEVYVMEEIKR